MSEMLRFRRYRRELTVRARRAEHVDPAGCIALTDRDIDEIWRIVADGTPIVIEP